MTHRGAGAAGVGCVGEQEERAREEAEYAEFAKDRLAEKDPSQTLAALLKVPHLIRGCSRAPHARDPRSDCG